MRLPCEQRWIDTHQKQIRERQKEYRRLHPLRDRRKEHQQYFERYPEKVKAQRNASRDLPIDSICFRCGSVENLERHHPDYSKPLIIVTVCRSCHMKIHGLSSLNDKVQHFQF
jgi:hypothetical protein